MFDSTGFRQHVTQRSRLALLFCRLWQAVFTVPLVRVGAVACFSFSWLCCLCLRPQLALCTLSLYLACIFYIWPILLECGLLCVLGLLCWYLVCRVCIWPDLFVFSLISVCIWHALLALGLLKSTVGFHSFLLFAQFALGHRELRVCNFN